MIYLQTGVPGGRTLGRLANHIIETVTEMSQQMGLPITEVYVNYTTVDELATHYKKYADQLAGMTWKNGFSHHRAQIRVLMRISKSYFLPHILQIMSRPSTLNRHL